MKEESHRDLDSRHDREQSYNHVFTGRLFRRQNIHGHTFTDKPKPPPRESVRRPARISILLALAHKIQRSIDDGEYRDLADAAQQIGYTRARISQIIKLLVLAPDIQEEILLLKRLDGREPNSERTIREVLRFDVWVEQRETWNFKFKSSHSELR